MVLKLSSSVVVINIVNMVGMLSLGNSVEVSVNSKFVVVLLCVSSVFVCIKL